METIRNETRLLPLNLQFFAEPGGDSGAGGAGGEGNPGAAGENNPGGAAGENNAPDDNKMKNLPEDTKQLIAQLEQIRQDFAKQKEALDKATKEAASYKRDLRAKQTQEEIDAANKKEAEEKQAKELEDLRREVSRAKSTKSVMSKLSVDEDTAGRIAECLTGCEDVDNALLLIQKAWEAKEKALRLEFGKIPGPGAGGSSEEDAEEKAAIELAKKLGRERSEANKNVAEGLKGYIR